MKKELYINGIRIRWNGLFYEALVEEEDFLDHPF